MIYIYIPIFQNSILSILLNPSEKGLAALLPVLDQEECRQHLAESERRAELEKQQAQLRGN